MNTASLFFENLSLSLKMTFILILKYRNCHHLKIKIKYFKNNFELLLTNTHSKQGSELERLQKKKDNNYIIRTRLVKNHKNFSLHVFT